MRIEVVRNVDIQPKYKSIYIPNIKIKNEVTRNSFDFIIHHGSGYFSVTTNTSSDIANVIHRDRTVTIEARNEGAILIKVEDIEIPGSEIATAEILISDIFKLELTSSG